MKVYYKVSYMVHVEHIQPPSPQIQNLWGEITSCIEVHLMAIERIIIDAGTGIFRYRFWSLIYKANRINILLTHLHMDS